MTTYDNGTDYDIGPWNGVTFYFRQYRSMTVCYMNSGTAVNFNFTTWTKIANMPSGMRVFSFLSMPFQAGHALLRCSNGGIDIITFNGGTAYVQGSGCTLSTRP